MPTKTTIIDPVISGHDATLDARLVVVRLDRPHLVRVTTSDRREAYYARRAEVIANPLLRTGVTDFGTPRLLAHQAF